MMETVTVEFNGTPITMEVPKGSPDEFITRFAYDKYREMLEVANAPIESDLDGAFARDMEKVTDDTSGFVTGAGRTVDQWVAGAENLIAKATGDERKQKRIALRESLEDRLYEKLQDAKPVSTMAGEIAPYLVGGGSSITSQALTGAVQAGLTYGENQGEQALIGGALSAAPGLIGKGYKVIKHGAQRLNPMPTTDEMIEGVARRIDAEKFPPRTSNQIADANNFPLTPGQRSGSRMLQNVEAGLDSHPLTSGVTDSIRHDQMSAINRMVAESMGEKGVTEMTEEVLNNAHDRISRKFNLLTIGREMQVDDALRGTLQKLDDEVAEGIFDRDIAKGAIKKLLNKADNGSPITDKDYQKISSQITRRLKNKNMDGDEKEVIGAIKDALDDFVERNLDGGKLDEFKEARSQWKAYKYATEFTKDGNVSGPMLANKLQRMDERGFTRGQNRTPLYDAARLGRSYRPVIGNSGTANRMNAAALLTGGGLYANSDSHSEGMDNALLGALLMAGGSRAYLRGGSNASLANLIGRSANATKKAPLDPRLQALLGRGLAGTYVANE